MRSPSVSMVLVPVIPEESMERLISYGKVVVECPDQIVGGVTASMSVTVS